MMPAVLFVDGDPNFWGGLLRDFGSLGLVLAVFIGGLLPLWRALAPELVELVKDQRAFVRHVQQSLDAAQIVNRDVIREMQEQRRLLETIIAKLADRK